MQWLEMLSWRVGITLTLLFFAAVGLGAMERERDIATFDRARQATSIQATGGVDDTVADTEGAVAVTSQSGPGSESVLGILRIPAIELEVPVNYGTGAQVLRRGAGSIEGTALPGSDGNVAIAAHRDTHFRGLKNLELGDVIELETLERTQTYIVTGLTVVEPTDIHVLTETGAPVLTLVTCYPFSFVGSAPQRFIVRAEAAGLSI